MALEITDDNFEDVVLKSDKPVLVDFWAEWCGPCRMVGPVVEELAKEYDGRAVIGKVNVDQNSSISSNYGIRNIPTLLYFKNGILVDKQVGVVPKATLAAKLEAQL
jgi:thioredoxin 1